MSELLVVLLVLYFVPTLVAQARGLGDVGTTLWLNLIAGWTAWGWLYLLATALFEKPPDAE